MVLIPDSFGPRGYPDGVCTMPLTPERITLTAARGTEAYAALAYLRMLPFVVGKRDARSRYDAFRTNINKPEGKGATTGGDPAAWADAIREVKAFFGLHLAAR